MDEWEVTRYKPNGCNSIPDGIAMSLRLREARRRYLPHPQEFHGYSSSVRLFKIVTELETLDIFPFIHLVREWNLLMIADRK